MTTASFLSSVKVLLMGGSSAKLGWTSKSIALTDTIAGSNVEIIEFQDGNRMKSSPYLTLSDVTCAVWIIPDTYIGAFAVDIGYLSDFIVKLKLGYYIKIEKDIIYANKDEIVIKDKEDAEKLFYVAKNIKKIIAGDWESFLTIPAVATEFLDNILHAENKPESQ